MKNTYLSKNSPNRTNLLRSVFFMTAFSVVSMGTLLLTANVGIPPYLTVDSAFAQADTDLLDENDNENNQATSSATTEKLRERIEKIVDEKRDQIRGVIDEFSEQKRGTIGQVTRLSEESVTITTKKTTEIIPVDDTVTLFKDGDEIELDEIAVDDWLVVMGIIVDDTFQPVRILVSSDSLRPDTPVVELGTITTIDDDELTISPRDQSDTFTIEVTSSTAYQDIEGNEIELSDITEEMQALVVGFEDEDNQRSATLIRILTVANLDLTGSTDDTEE